MAELVALPDLKPSYQAIRKLIKDKRDGEAIDVPKSPLDTLCRAAEQATSSQGLETEDSLSVIEPLRERLASAAAIGSADGRELISVPRENLHALMKLGAALIQGTARSAASIPVAKVSDISTATNHVDNAVGCGATEAVSAGSIVPEKPSGTQADIDAHMVEETEDGDGSEVSVDVLRQRLFSKARREASLCSTYAASLGQLAAVAAEKRSLRSHATRLCTEVVDSQSMLEASHDSWLSEQAAEGKLRHQAQNACEALEASLRDSRELLAKENAASAIKLAPLQSATLDSSRLALQCEESAVAAVRIMQQYDVALRDARNIRDRAQEELEDWGVNARNAGDSVDLDVENIEPSAAFAKEPVGSASALAIEFQTVQNEAHELRRGIRYLERAAEEIQKSLHSAAPRIWMDRRWACEVPRLTSQLEAARLEIERLQRQTGLLRDSTCLPQTRVAATQEALRGTWRFIAELLEYRELLRLQLTEVETCTKGLAIDDSASMIEQIEIETAQHAVNHDHTAAPPIQDDSKMPPTENIIVATENESNVLPSEFDAASEVLATENDGNPPPAGNDVASADVEGGEQIVSEYSGASEELHAEASCLSAKLSTKQGQLCRLANLVEQEKSYKSGVERQLARATAILQSLQNANEMLGHDAPCPVLTRPLQDLPATKERVCKELLSADFHPELEDDVENARLDLCAAIEHGWHKSQESAAQRTAPESVMSAKETDGAAACHIASTGAVLAKNKILEQKLRAMSSLPLPPVADACGEGFRLKAFDINPWQRMQDQRHSQSQYHDVSETVAVASAKRRLLTARTAWMEAKISEDHSMFTGRRLDKLNKEVIERASVLEGAVAAQGDVREKSRTLGEECQKLSDQLAADEAALAIQQHHVSNLMGRQTHLKQRELALKSESLEREETLASMIAKANSTTKLKLELAEEKRACDELKEHHSSIRKRAETTRRNRSYEEQALTDQLARIRKECQTEASAAKAEQLRARLLADKRSKELAKLEEEESAASQVAKMAVEDVTLENGVHELTELRAKLNARKEAVLRRRETWFAECLRWREEREEVETEAKLVYKQMKEAKDGVREPPPTLGSPAPNIAASSPNLIDSDTVQVQNYTSEVLSSSQSALCDEVDSAANKRPRLETPEKSSTLDVQNDTVEVPAPSESALCDEEDASAKKRPRHEDPEKPSAPHVPLPSFPGEDVGGETTAGDGAVAMDPVASDAGNEGSETHS